MTDLSIDCTLCKHYRQHYYINANMLVKTDGGHCALTPDKAAGNDSKLCDRQCSAFSAVLPRVHRDTSSQLIDISNQLRQISLLLRLDRNNIR